MNNLSNFKSLTAVLLFVSITALFVLGPKRNNPYVSRPVPPRNQQPISPIEQNNQIEIISEINKRNDKVFNLSYENVEIGIESKYLKLKGWLAYSKPLNFRMSQNSMLGKELDIGSNQSIFWFWSKRMKPPSLYYTEHENVLFSRLKTPFQPIWLKEIMGIDKIDTNANVYENDYSYVIIEKRKGQFENPTTKMTVVDKQTMAISSHSLFDDAGEVIAIAEILESYKIGNIHIPKIIKTNWIEEGKEAIMKLYYPAINQKIDSDLWSPPAIKDKINIAFKH